MLAQLSLAAAAAFGPPGGDGGCVVTPVVDRHMLRNAMDARLFPTLSWIISPGCGPEPQTSARVEIASGAGEPLWQTVAASVHQGNLTDVQVCV